MRNAPEGLRRETRLCPPTRNACVTCFSLPRAPRNGTNHILELPETPTLGRIGFVFGHSRHARQTTTRCSRGILTAAPRGRKQKHGNRHRDRDGRVGISCIGSDTPKHSTRHFARRWCSSQGTFRCSSWRVSLVLLSGRAARLRRARCGPSTLLAESVPSALTRWPVRPVRAGNPAHSRAALTP
jgi:hypothetical protein